MTYAMFFLGLFIGALLGFAVSAMLCAAGREMDAADYLPAKVGEPADGSRAWSDRHPDERESL